MSLRHRDGLRGRQYHFVDRTTAGHHRIHALEGRHLYVQQVRTGFPHRFFERLSQLPRLVDGAALEAVGAGLIRATEVVVPAQNRS